MAKLLPSRHVVYHQVIEALELDGCPVCRLGLRTVSRYLDGLAYENVNDPHCRAELRAARGFCSLHAWQFAEEIRDGLGTAIIYRDVVGEALRVLGAPRRRLSWLWRRGLAAPTPSAPAAELAGSLAPQQECPACRRLQEASSRYLSALLAHLGDSVLRRRYSDSDGLCLPHLAASLQRAPSERDKELLILAFARRAGSRVTTAPKGLEAESAALLQMLVGKEGAVPFPGHSAAATSPMIGSPGVEVGPLQRETNEPSETCLICVAAASSLDRWLLQVADGPAEHQAPDSEPGSPVCLCNAHAWRLWRVAGGQRVARLLRAEALRMRDRLQSERAALASTGPGWRPLRARAGRAAAPELWPAAGCVACAGQAAIERRLVLALLDLLQSEPQPVLRRLLPALCLPHLRLGLGLATDQDAVTQLVTGQLKALQGLRSELGEYIRKQDYRFRHEPFGPAEASSPWRTIAHVAGLHALPSAGAGEDGSARRQG